MLRSSGVALLLFFFLVVCVNSQTNDALNGSEPTFQSKVRVVVVDIAVTDKNHQPVSGLKQEDFQVFEQGKPQTIASFEEHKGAPPNDAVQPPFATPPGPNFFTNYPLNKPADSVNVLLLDALNTPAGDQMNVRKQMVSYLKNLKPGPRLAIFTLSTRLRMVEGFTADPAALLDVLNNKNSGGGPQSSILLRSAVDDSAEQQTLNNMVVNTGPGGMSGQLQASIAAMRDFLNKQNESQDRVRGKDTLDALQELARYLSGFPGRKNVIWFAGSFPGWNLRAAEGPGDIAEKIRKTTNMLTSAQVALYPVTAQGLDTDSLYDASALYTPDATGTGGEAGMPNQGAAVNAQNKSLHQDRDNRVLNHTAMDDLAIDTGGKAFYNTNGLDGAMNDVISNGTHYYTISYSPTDKRIDSRYRPIEVRLSDGHYKLSYRRGYFAEDAKSKKTDEAQPNVSPMQSLMWRGTPDATQILYQIHVLPKDAQPSAHTTIVGDNPKFQGPAIRYAVDFDVETNDLSLEAGPDGTHHGSLETSLVVYDHDGNLLNWIARRIELSYKPDRYAVIEQSGIPFHLEIDAPKGDVYLRSGVYETSTNKAGTLEIPLNTIKLSLRPAEAQAPSEATELASNVEHSNAPQIRQTPNPQNEGNSGQPVPQENPVAVASSSSPTEEPINPAASAPETKETGPIPYKFKAASRIVVVDVVAKDSKGAPVRYLKNQDFKIAEKVDWVKEVPQKIVSVRAIDTSHYANKKSGELPHPLTGIYSNLAAKQDADVPLTVLLLDGINSNLFDPEISKSITKMAEAIPNRPMAVFLLSDKLALLQDFTTDQKSLRAAVTKIYAVGPYKTFQINDSTGPSADLQERFGVPFNSSAPVLQHWNRRIQGEGELDRRVQNTIDAMRTIARHLAGYPGRKKLIWVSSSFPFSIGPGNFANLAEDSHNFHDQIQVVTNALSNARVAVYPADPGGLWTSNACSASTISCPQGAQYVAVGRMERLSHRAAEATMEEFATQTGGAECINDNSLADCLKKALDDGSYYYEVTYSPSQESWKEGFHRIVVKTDRPGVHLAFRRGYYAGVEESAGNKADASNGTNPILKQAACNDVMAATALPFTVQSMRGDAADMAKYELFVDGKQFPLLDATEKEQQQKIHLDLSVCTFDANGKVLQYIQKPIDELFTSADYETLRNNGMRRSIAFQPAKGVAQLRVLIRDGSTGDMGSIDMRYPDQSNVAVGNDSESPVSADSVFLATNVDPGGEETNVAPATEMPALSAAEIGSYCKSVSSVADHSDALTNVCEFALMMRKRLPDVICDREMQRHWRTPGEWQGGAYARRDVITAKVAYRNGIEYYDNLRVDGKSTDLNSRALVGATYSSGEFATILAQVFSPLSDTEFRFEKEEVFHSVPALVFKFDVQQQNNQVYFLHARNAGSGSWSWFPAYHGWLWLDKNTFQLLKLQRVTMEMPYAPIRRADTEIEYAKVPLGDGSEFVLPTNSDVLTCANDDKEDECAHNLIKFTNWHKFRAKTQILMNPTQ